MDHMKDLKIILHLQVPLSKHVIREKFQLKQNLEKSVVKKMI